MRKPMSVADHGFFQLQRSIGILTEMNGDVIRRFRDFQFVACGDGHRIQELWEYMFYLGPCAEADCTHSITVNGGPLALSSRCSFSTQERDGRKIPADLFLLNQIEGGIKLGKGETILLIGHWPCGLAGMYNYTLKDALRFTKEAKLRLRQEINPTGEIICLFHLDFMGYGNHFRTYRFDPSEFEKDMPLAS